jgi:aspartyl aminopeptidase
LKNHGCKEIKENDGWNDGLIQLQGEYYFTCNGSALIAFEAGVQHNGGIW